MSAVNLEAVIVNIYPTQFVISGDKDITGVSSKLIIDRRNQSITQTDQSYVRNGRSIKRIKCCALLGILPILNRHYLLIVESCLQTCWIGRMPIYQIKQIGLIPFQQELPANLAHGQEVLLKEKQQQAQLISYINYLKTSLLVQGYYFSYQYMLSLSKNAYAAGYPSNKKFLWNHHIAKHFLKLEDQKWFVPMIQGFVNSFKVTLQGTVIQYTLITRRSWMRGGTRYNSRGIDLLGNVANFCETEQIIHVGDHCYSHLQIRGSVPIFWRQTGVTGEVQLHHAAQQNTLAFTKHFEKLIRHYGNTFCTNLLSKQKVGEIDLILYYQKLMKETTLSEIRYEYFDVHGQCKGINFERCNYLIAKLEGVNRFFGFYKENSEKQVVMEVQRGVVRTNCLDSLDRTNLVQSKIAYLTLSKILFELGFDLKAAVGKQSIVEACDDAGNTSSLVMHLKNIWADNGDMISKHYTGTGSTHTNVTRTGVRDFKGIMDHGFKSAKRLYKQFFEDNQKQQAIDLLIGQHTETANLEELQARMKRLTKTPSQASIQLGNTGEQREQ